MMNKDWLSITLEKFVSLQRGYDLPENIRKPGNIPVMGSFGITGYHNTSRVKGPGIVIGRSGASFGVVSFSPIDFWPLNTTLFVTDFHGNNEHFAYYFLRSLDFAGYNSGSAQPSLNRNYIYPMSITIPSLPEQQAIAHILGSLDDKIELNRQMNETLEGIARALFKSWFVDFDPVRAKMEGRQPYGMDAETAALFPDGFEDSKLGEIPISWEVVKLSRVAAVNEISLTKDFPYEEIEYIDISSVSTGKLVGTSRYASSMAPSRAKRIVRHGDTIWSTVRPNRKSYLFIHTPLDNLVVSTGFAVLTPKSVPPTYLYAWVTTDRFIEYLMYNADGSAYPAVLPGRFSDATTLLPSLPILQKFENLISHMRSLIFRNDEEAQTLATLRDTLLPKLLSGAIRVKDAEKVVGSVL